MPELHHPQLPGRLELEGVVAKPPGRDLAPGRATPLLVVSPPNRATMQVSGGVEQRPLKMPDSPPLEPGWRRSDAVLAKLANRGLRC